jgi:HK97 family phage portal protein
MYERAYAEIVRDGAGVVRQLWRLDPARMTVSRDALNRKTYTYRLADGTTTTWTFDASRPPVLDLVYRSPLAQCRDLIGLALALDTYAAKFFANSARPSGVLTTPKQLSDVAADKLLKRWKATYGGAKNAHKVAILEEDVKFQAITATNEQAQFLELRKFVRTQIAGVFKVPPHKVGDLERATFSNIEHQSREYVASLAPLFLVFEQSIRRDLLTTRQYPRYRAVFDYETLIETDIQSRMTAFATARQNGIYSADDCRRKLKENPIGAAAGGNLYHMNGNMIPLTGPTSAAFDLPLQPAPAAEADTVN